MADSMTKTFIVTALIVYIATSGYHSWHDACFSALGVALGLVARSVWPRPHVPYHETLSRRRDDEAA